MALIPLTLQSFFTQNPQLEQFCRENNILAGIEELLQKFENGFLDKAETLGQIAILFEKSELSFDLQQQIEQIEQAEKTIIIGNGDVQSLLDAEQKVDEYGVDGVMFGRAIFKNPFLFNKDVQMDEKGNLFFVSTGQIVNKMMRIKLLLEHLELWQNTWQNQKNYAILKKYFKIYISSFEGSSELRAKLMETNNVEEARTVLSANL